MQQKLVAIDAHKRTCTAVVLDGWDPVGKPQRFPSTVENLRKLAREHPDAHFALEACSVQEWMIDTLREGGVDAQAYTPPKKQRKGKKSDPRDALRLGRKVLLQDVNLVRVPTPEERRIRDRVRQRQYLVAQRTRFVNRIQHALNRRGLRKPTDAGGPHADEEAEHAVAMKHRDQALAALPDLADEYALVDALDERIQPLDKQVQRLGNGIHEVELLKSIPGFGPVVSLAFHVETGPATRFPKAASLVNYYGLDPEGDQSGDTYIDKHQISKKGRSYIRGLLVQAAWSHVRWCPESDISQKYHRLAAERGKLKGEAIVAAAAHLVRVAWTMLIEDRAFTLNRPARRATCRDPSAGRRDR